MLRNTDTTWIAVPYQNPIEYPMFAFANEDQDILGEESEVTIDGVKMQKYTVVDDEEDFEVGDKLW